MNYVEDRLLLTWGRALNLSRKVRENHVYTHKKPRRRGRGTWAGGGTPRTRSVPHWLREQLCDLTTSLHKPRGGPVAPAACSSVPHPLGSTVREGGGGSVTPGPRGARRRGADGPAVQVHPLPVPLCLCTDITQKMVADNAGSQPGRVDAATPPTYRTGVGSGAGGLARTPRDAAGGPDGASVFAGSKRPALGLQPREWGHGSDEGLSNDHPASPPTEHGVPRNITGVMSGAKN